MRVLMFGWEFPPFSYGGLGTACKGIIDGLSHYQAHITLVLPQAHQIRSEKLQITQIDKLLKNCSMPNEKLAQIVRIDSVLMPYCTSESYQKYLKKIKILQKNKDSDNSNVGISYGRNLFEEIQRYSEKAYLVGKNTPHDIIHTHDWLTMPAGIMAKKASSKPLISHIHATEFDRTGDNPNQQVYETERAGMEASDHIIAVSKFTKQKIIQHYGIAPDKITVVHNAVTKEKKYCVGNPQIGKKDHVILFLGRITIQKGPEYFLRMAKRVLEYEPNTKFVMAGSGDMMHRMIDLSIHLGIAKNVLFAGYLKGHEIDQAYAHADLYIMPSISEPFGISPLEAIRNGTPVLISKQSGVSEVIRNALRVDFWDIEDMANKTLAVLRYKKLKELLASKSQQEIHRMSWKKQAGKIHNIYREIHALQF